MVKKSELKQSKKEKVSMSKEKKIKKISSSTVDMLDDTRDDDLNDFEQNSTKLVQEVKKPKESKRMKKIENMIEGMELNTGVLYVAHLPWGVTEDIIKKYFEQFGKINRYLLPRSKNTGRIKGYCFIEYDSLEVAEIAAKTMDKFILFDRILKCDVVYDRARYNKIFSRWKRQFKFFNKYNKFVEIKNKKKSTVEMKNMVELYLEKEAKKRQKLKEFGIDYNFPGYKKFVELNKAK